MGFRCEVLFPGGFTQIGPCFIDAARFHKSKLNTLAKCVGTSTRCRRAVNRHVIAFWDQPDVRIQERSPAPVIRLILLAFRFPRMSTEGGPFDSEQQPWGRWATRRSSPVLVLHWTLTSYQEAYRDKNMNVNHGQEPIRVRATGERVSRLFH